MGYRLLGVQETPDVTRPVVTVSTAWPGADPAIVESDVSEVLERELNGIEGVLTLTSTSQEGSSQVLVEFDLDRDLEAAANDVRSRVGRARRKLPDDVDEPIIEKADASAQPVMFLRLAADDKNLLDITEIADTIVRDRIENVEGVSGVDIMGAQVYALRMELDASRMAVLGVTLSDIENTLRGGNVDVPAGRLEGDATQLTLHLDGGLRSAESFGALLLRTEGNRRVYLRDIATIRLGAENERTAARADGVPSVSISVTPQAKANIIAVSDEIRRRLSTIEADLPSGMALDMVYDRADAVRASIHDVQLTLLVAFALVVGVIFLFLRDWRSTLVPSLAIPVSIVGTFLVLWIVGFTINVFTLFGLVLAIGLVVDDAIVVLENIVRRIELGEPVVEASLLGTRQIAAPVVATTISLVAVFLPVIFTGGTTGRLFLEFGTTVAASVAISMVVALTLTPMLCSKLLLAHHGPTQTDAAPKGLARLFALSLGPVLRRPWVLVPVMVVAIMGVYLGFNKLPQEFFPTEDRNMFMIRATAQEGTSFPWMNARINEVEKQIMPLVPERTMMLARVATGPGGVVAGTNTGMLVFPLKPRSQRDRSQQQIVASLKGPLSQITAFRTVPVQFPTVGRGFSSPLQFVLQNADFQAIVEELPKFVAAMRAIPGLSSVNEDLRLDRPELWLHVNRERAAEVGVSLRDIAHTLQVLTSGLDISTFKRGVRQYKVIASLPGPERATPDDLRGVFVRSKAGTMVPLSTLIQSDERAGAASRYHYNRAPSATISANLDGITLGEGIARVQAMAKTELPEGFRTALAGEARDFAESSQSLAQMFLLALALVYLLLAAQFDSFIAPISIMLSVPLALAGAFGGLWIMGMSLSFFGQVGLILLVGLVTKNGILIVEYARQLEEERHLSPWQAAEEAAHLRFRPILMTSVATIGGAIPIAVGLSGESRASLGVAVVGGMLSATFLTLYVTPVVYAALASWGKKTHRVA
jgi:multidrug efflux pump